MSKIENKGLIEKKVEISVGDIYLYDEKTGVEEFSATLKNHEISKELESETKIKAGKNSNTIYAISGSADVKITVTDVLSSNLDQQKWGGYQELVGDSTVFSMHLPKQYVLSNGKEVTLKNTPFDSKEVCVYNLKTNAMIEPSKFTVSSNKISFTGTDIAEGDSVLVTGFKYKASSTAKITKITGKDNNATYFCVIEVDVMNKDLKVIGTKKYIFPKVQLTGTVFAKGETDNKNGMENTHNLTVLQPDNSEDLGYIIEEEI